MQKIFPQAMDVRRQVQLVQKPFHLIQIEGTEVLHAPVEKHLANIPGTLERVI